MNWEKRKMEAFVACGNGPDPLQWRHPERKGDLSCMLGETIKAIRRSKGLSQEELAIRLNVVRQTISKWENGLSVPDSDLLIALSEVLETPVSTLLGETVSAPRADDWRAVAEKLEVINL